MYIHVSWSWRHLGIVGHLFQVGIAILGLYIGKKIKLIYTSSYFCSGYTRIFDFHHHWHDVAVGAIVGSLVAFVTFKFILNWRHYQPRFLPYTVSAIKLNPLVTQNGGINTHDNRRVSPTANNEQNHYF